MTLNVRRPNAPLLGRAAAGLVLGALIVSLSCGRDVTGPGRGVRPSRALAIQPEFRAGEGEVSVTSGVAFERVRITLERLGGAISLDRVIDFPADRDSVPLTFTVDLSAEAPAAGEQMSLRLRFITAAGDTVFRSGPDLVLVQPFRAGEPPASVVVNPIYVGPGSQATRVDLLPVSANTQGGTAINFTAQAFDGQGNAVPTAPITFRSTDTTLVRFANSRSGSATTSAVRRGSATVIAALLTGPADSAVVTTTLPASAIAATQGNSQSGPAGNALLTPVAVRVTAADGLGVSGVTVTFAAANGGSVGAASVITNANGDASTTWILGPVAGAQSLTAAAAGLAGSPVTFAATATVTAATQLVFTAGPVNTQAGITIGTVTVAARDAQNNLVTGFTGAVTVALGANPGSGSLLGIVSANAVAGVATFVGVNIDRAAAGYTLVASSGALTPATSGAFTVTGGPAFTLSFGTQPTNTLAATPFNPTVQVAALDAFGNVATGFTGAVTISFGVNPSGATLGGTLVVNAVAGIANYAGLTVSTAGTGYQLAALSGVLGVTSVPFDVLATAPTQLVFTAQPTSALAGESLGIIIVAARDAQNSLVTAFTGPVTLSFGANPGTGALAGTLTTNAISGIASFAGVSIDRAAAGYTLVASSGALTAATSSPFAVTAAAATTLVFTVPPPSAPVETPLAPAVQVVARDAFNNTATGFTDAVTIAFGANPGGATLGGTLVVNAIAGVATFPGLTVSAIGAGYTLVASASGLTGATSTPFNTSAALIAWTNPAGGSWRTPSNWSLGRVPNAIDSVVIDLAGTYMVNLDTTFSGTFITVGGSSGTQTLALASRTLTIAGQLRTQGTGVLALTGSTLTGTGSLVNTATVSLFNSSIAVAVVNAGTLNGNATVNLNGALTTTASSLLRVRSDNSSGFATFTVATGFTNLGAIELTNAGNSYPAIFAVTAGTLVNAPGGTITSLVSLGNTRTLAAALDNQGLVTIAQPLTWGRTGAVHTNSGTIDVSGGNLDLSQSGGGLTNTGTLTIGAGRAFTTTSSAFTNNGGALTGTGTLAFASATATFATDFSNASLDLTLTNTTVNGPGILTNAAGRTLALFNTIVNTALVNAGTLNGNATVTLNGALTTTASSLLRVRSDNSSGFATFTVATGFTNLGAIELTNAGNSYPAIFAVTAGTLVNAPGGTITSLVSLGNTRTLAAALDNQGLVTIAQPLTWGRTGAVHTNSGTIDVSGGNLDLSQSGGGLTNTGTLTIGAGRAFTTTSSAFTNNGGALTGTGTLAFASATATFATDFSNASLDLTLTNTTVNGPGILTNAAGRTLALFNTIVNTALVNAGTLNGNATVTLNGALTTTASSLLRVRSDNSSGFATFTVATGFTNLGAIELTNAGNSYPAIFAVTAGTLVNAPGGTITSLVSLGNTRTLAAALDNQGLVTIAQPLTWGRTGAVHTNSGTIDVSGGNLDLSQSGGGLTNTGTLTIGAGRAFTTTSSAFTNNGGALTGTGTLAFASATATFATDFSNASLDLTLTNTTVNGPGILTNAAGRTLALFNTIVNTALVNAGTLNGNATVTLNGALTTTASSLLRVRSDNSSGFATFTVATGFTNLGAIELTNAGNSYPAIFAVTAGTLVNAPGGTITSLVSLGNTRTLAAALDNQGLVTIAQPLTWGRTGAVHTNSGTIDVSGGNLDLSQSGGGLTNTGTLTIGAGRAFTTTSSAFTNNGGALTGTGTLAFASATATFATDFSNASLDLTLTNTTVNGPGILTNAAGRTLALFNTIVNTALVNAGTLNGNATVTLNGALTTTASSLLRVRSDNSSGFATFTVATGFTNLGAIELTNAGNAYPATFAVTAGTLVNAPGGTISSLLSLGSTRTLTANVDNQGLLSVSPGAASTLNINGSLTTSGTISLDLGGLTAGSQYDQIAVTGALTLDGILNVGFFGGFVPVSTNSFTVLTNTGVRTGGFATTNLAAPLGPNPLYGANSVIVSVP